MRIRFVLALGLMLVGLGGLLWWLQAGDRSPSAAPDLVVEASAPSPRHRSMLSPDSGSLPDGRPLPRRQRDGQVVAGIDGLRSESAAMRFERASGACVPGSFTGVTVRRLGAGDDAPTRIAHKFPSVLTDLAPGDYVLSVSTPSWKVEPSRITLNAYDTALVTVTPVTRVTGVVIDRFTGLPIDGASVRLLGSTSHVSAEAPLFSLITMRASEAVDGSFCLAGFAVEGDTRVIVSAEGYLPGMSEWLSVAGGMQWTGIVVDLSQPVEVSGFVLDVDSGEPLRGVQLRLDARGLDGEPSLDQDDESFLLDRVWDSLPHETLSSDDGAFALRTGTGQLLLAADLEGYRSTSLPLIAMAPGPLPELVLTLERAPALWVQVLVEDPGVKPVLLLLKPLALLEPNDHDEVLDPELSKRDIEGRSMPSDVPFVGLASGRYEVSLLGVASGLESATDGSGDASTDDPLSSMALLATAEIDVIEGESQAVQIVVRGSRHSAGITGLLIPAPEIPPEEIVIVAQIPGQRLPVGMTEPDSAGKFSLTGLPEGELCVMAVGASADGSRVGIAIHCWRAKAGTVARDVVLDMLTSRLRLTSPRDRVVTVRIAAAQTGSSFMDAALQSSGPMVGDASGVYELYGLPDGDYTLEATEGGKRWPFSIGHGSARQVELFLADDA